MNGHNKDCTKIVISLYFVTVWIHKGFITYSENHKKTENKTIVFNIFLY